MTVFLKITKINLLLNKALQISEIKDDRFIIRCAIKLYINIVNTFCVYWWGFYLQSGLNCVPIFFIWFWASLSGIICNRRPPVKMVDFHGEVTFLSVFDGI
jgi:hypothetical protein